MKPRAPFLLALITSPAILAAQSSQNAAAPRDTAVAVSWGAFVDGYYAWDFQRPPNFERTFAGGTLFTTQPARHNEFNVNLAFVEVKATGDRVRGRLALQAGTSVQSNYSGEPQNGVASGASLAQHIQEAFAGVRIAPTLWIDGGIFFSHMGMESFISRDNPTYTRSLVADYSPYYQSGVKLTWAASPKVTAQLDVVNGWQNISENNAGKGVGARVDYTPTPSATLSYYNFFSQEAGTRLRALNGVGAKATVGRLTVLGELDGGMQDAASNTTASSSTTWYGFTVLARAEVSATAALSARIERFDDRDQTIIGTGSLGGIANPAFRANGASLGVDWSPQSRVMWRTEVRGFLNDRALFADGASGTPSKRDLFAVTSLALTF